MAQLGYLNKKSKGRGVILDVKSQIFIFTLKKGVVPDKVKMTKAIVDAGYSPSIFYKPVKRGGKIKISQFKLGK